MTTESGSDSESKDKEQDQQESPAQQGAAETQPQEQQPPPSEEHPNAVEQFSAVAAHSTPVKKEQVREPRHAASRWPTSELKSKGSLGDEAAAAVNLASAAGANGARFEAEGVFRVCLSFDT